MKNKFNFKYDVKPTYHEYRPNGLFSNYCGIVFEPQGDIGVDIKFRWGHIESYETKLDGIWVRNETNYFALMPKANYYAKKLLKDFKDIIPEHEYQDVIDFVGNVILKEFMILGVLYD